MRVCVSVRMKEGLGWVWVGRGGEGMGQGKRWVRVVVGEEDRSTALTELWLARLDLSPIDGFRDLGYKVESVV